MISPIVSANGVKAFGKGGHVWTAGEEWEEKELEERVKKAIEDIARRRNNVTLNEIEWVVGKLAARFSIRRRQARHGVLFGVGDQRFMVNCHNPGSKQVKSYSVDEFINAMTELGLYEGEEEETKENE
jgi:hypothetical protein